MAETQIIPTDIRQLWDNASHEVRSALAKEQITKELQENSNKLDAFIKGNRESLQIPQHDRTDLLDRIAFGLNSITSALNKNKNVCNKISVLSISKRGDDGELEYEKEVDGNIEMNFTKIHDDITALIIQRIMARTLIHIDQGTVGNYRDFQYEMIDLFKITRNYAADKLFECMCLTAKILEIPVNILPFEKGRSSKLMFGMIDLCYDKKETISFENGNWPSHGIHQMSRWMYHGSNNHETETNANEESIRWSFKGDIGAIKYVIMFEKKSLAKKFWTQLSTEMKPKFLLLVTGGVPSSNYFIVRKFLYLAKMAVSEECWSTHYSTGDCDPASFMIQYQLETMNKLSGHSDQHLLMPVRMIGPFPLERDVAAPAPIG
eukprot:scaffold54222_cov65-Cyclotella_meneghiniana.AAC.2